MSRGPRPSFELPDISSDCHLSSLFLHADRLHRLALKDRLRVDQLIALAQDQSVASRRPPLGSIDFDFLAEQVRLQTFRRYDLSNPLPRSDMGDILRLSVTIDTIKHQVKVPQAFDNHDGWKEGEWKSATAGLSEVNADHLQLALDLYNRSYDSEEKGDIKGFMAEQAVAFLINSSGSPKRAALQAPAELDIQHKSDVIYHRIVESKFTKDREKDSHVQLPIQIKWGRPFDEYGRLPQSRLDSLTPDGGVLVVLDTLTGGSGNRGDKSSESMRLVRAIVDLTQGKEISPEDQVLIDKIRELILQLIDKPIQSRYSQIGIGRSAVSATGKTGLELAS